jgi:hypothetical protein
MMDLTNRARGRPRSRTRRDGSAEARPDAGSGRRGACAARPSARGPRSRRGRRGRAGPERAGRSCRRFPSPPPSASPEPSRRPRSSRGRLGSPLFLGTEGERTRDAEDVQEEHRHPLRTELRHRPGEAEHHGAVSRHVEHDVEVGAEARRLPRMPGVEPVRPVRDPRHPTRARGPPTEAPARRPGSRGSRRRSPGSSRGWA